MSGQVKDLILAEAEKKPGGFKVRIYWFLGVFSFILAVLVVLAAWSTVVILARYLAIAITAFVAIGAIVGGGYLVWLAIHTLRHKARRDEALTRKLENEAAIVTHDHNHVAYVVKDKELWPIYSPQLRQSDTLPMLPAGQSIDLLSALDNVQRCLIVGASDTGKTTLLQWLVARRLAGSKVVVVDPHSFPSKWPGGCVVVGTGRAYDKIDQTLTGLVALMSKRYTEIGAGTVPEMGHSRITVLIDEWRAITGNVTGAGDAIKALLTESRKAAMSIFVASHSDRAKPLGLMGEYDLKDGFAVVRLSVANGRRLATLDTGSGEVPASLPGPYMQGFKVKDFTLKTDPLDDLPQPEPNPTEAGILRRYDSGETISQIAMAVFGLQNGFNSAKVKDVLGRYGRTVKDARRVTL